MDLLETMLHRRSTRTYTGEAVRALLGVPAPYRLEGLLALGAPKTLPAPHTLADVNKGKIHWGRF